MIQQTAFISGIPLSYTRFTATNGRHSMLISSRRISSSSSTKIGSGRSRRCVPMMTADEMPEEAKAAVARGENVKYWAGEWICVDCGFIYKPKRKIKFEDLPGSWKCPQCNAPKRRFAKKAGDYIAETAGTSNLPIILFSILGLVATIAFGIWASKEL